MRLLSPNIMWFRRDLRLSDNPALLAASSGGEPVVPVFLLDPQGEGKWARGSASRWWLHHSLQALDMALQRLGSRLIIRRGNPLDLLVQIARQVQGNGVFWNTCGPPEVGARDADMHQALLDRGLAVRTLKGDRLVDPSAIKTQTGSPYQIFTPFWRSALAHHQPRLPLASPTRLVAPKKWPASDSVESLGLLPRIDWAGSLRSSWQPGELGAWQLMNVFLDTHLADYDHARDRPDHQGSSRLSPHLHFGEISAAQVWNSVTLHLQSQIQSSTHRSGRAFLRQLGWREFAYYLLHHYPETSTHPFRHRFQAMTWADHPAAIRVWQTGQTGYPLVDAGMRELWATGWMHNRVRMVTGSFLCKHLLVNWPLGAQWFWDTLVDADLANNTLGWQWVAGCGADAAPFFRIFNPVTQGLKFDPQGDYVRKWVPELAKLPVPWIHQPWKAPPIVLRDSGLTLGKTYPCPIVDHTAARERALKAFSSQRD